MKTTLTLDGNDIRAIIAEHFEVAVDDVLVNIKTRFEGVGPMEHKVSYIEIDVKQREKDLTFEPQAYWEYWAGWRSNHDRRIDDATCSNCGFKHPTVRGYGEVSDQLYKICPMCGKRMGRREV